MRSFLLKNSKHFKCFSVQRFPIRSLSSNVLVNNDDFGGRGVVQRLKLNNPKKRNALSLAMLQELNHHFELMEKQCISPTTTSESTSKTNEEQRLLRALVISSNCEKIFSSGHDLKELLF